MTRRALRHLAFDQLSSPIGTVILACDEAGLCLVDFADYEARARRFLEKRFGAIELAHAKDPHGATSALAAYFAGRIDAVDTVAVSLGGTPFQQTAWQALRQIRPGSTTTYRGLADVIGRPSAIRAAGRANALNPICIVVPCHRVIGSDGSLTGYGGGLERKRWLLRHEGVRLPN